MESPAIAASTHPMSFQHFSSRLHHQSKKKLPSQSLEPPPLDSSRAQGDIYRQFADMSPAASKDDSHPALKGPSALRSILAGSTAGAVEIGELRVMSRSQGAEESLTGL